MNEPRLKMEITSRLKGTGTRCTVPAGSCVPDKGDGAPLLTAGESFVFEIERCHLTHENYSDGPCLRAIENEPPRFDIAADMWFRGVILIGTATSRPITCLSHDAHPFRGVAAEVPIRWISEVYEWRGDDRSPVPVPIPNAIP